MRSGFYMNIVVVVVVVFTLKAVPISTLLSNIRTGPTDASPRKRAHIYQVEPFFLSLLLVTICHWVEPFEFSRLYSTG